MLFAVLGCCLTFNTLSLVPSTTQMHKIKAQRQFCPETLITIDFSLKHFMEARELAERLRAFVSVAEELGSSMSTHKAAHNFC